MTTDVGVKKPGSRTAGAGLLIAAIGAILLIAGMVGGGPSALSVLVIVAGLIVAGIGFARRVLRALENR